jgi:peroxiredoxin
MRISSSPPMIANRLLGRCRVVSLAIAGILASQARAADPPAASSTPVLHLADGGYAAGEIRDSSRPGVLRWQAASFVAPFDFAIKDINTIQWPPPAKLDRPTGDFCFELAAGDVLFGSLLGLDEKKVELDIPRSGRIHVQRANLHRIYRWRDGADLIYLGPNGLVGWHEPAGQKNWREDSGQPTTDREGASIRGDFGLPSRANIEFEISWKSKPDFVLALGVDDKDSTVKRAFRFEAWGGDLVVQRELEQEADLAVVQEVTAGPGRTHLQAYLDQQEGRILVFSPGGKQLADLKVAGNKPAALPGIYLANIRGDVRLEWLRIGRWNGEIPREARTDMARIHRADGSIAYGQLTGFRPDAKEFLVRGEKGESRVKEGDVSSVFLSPAKPESPRLTRAVYQDGSRLSGELTKVEGGTVALKVPGVEESLKLPIAGLRSLVVLAHEAAESKSATMPRLETEGLRLVGRLEDGREGPGVSCLVWHPAGSATASPMRPGVSGKIFYKEPPPQPSRRPANPNQQGQQGMGGMALRFAQALAETPESPSGEERRALFLRSGDVITSVITGIDENGVRFRSSMSTSTLIPHDKVKAVELSPLSGALAVKLSKAKKERLLTLPRMQKASPPTHLIRSTNGDYLRGRVVMMDDKRVRVETRLEEKDLPRDRIAQIIWLHPEELDPSKKPATTERTTRVQAVRNDGIRVTFTPEQFAGDTLSGRSDVLGATRVRVGEIDQLLIGAGIEEAAAHLVYGQWKLQNAPEPVEPAPEGGSPGGGASGTESPLVGKPAPDFELELVDGKRFHLAGSKGKVVVLDFWATWCGPCIQAMPQVEKVTAEFGEKDVQLVAVNLQETPQQIKAMLERHQLRIPRVALDKDGAIAEKYQANAIPQTVIIGRDGTIARLFVGGGPHLGDQLREAIKATMDGEQPSGK